MKKASIKNTITSKAAHNKKSSQGPPNLEKASIKRVATASKKLATETSQTRFMAFQDEDVNRR